MRNLFFHQTRLCPSGSAAAKTSLLKLRAAQVTSRGVMQPFWGNAIAGKRARSLCCIFVSRLADYPLIARTHPQSKVLIADAFPACLRTQFTSEDLYAHERFLPQSLLMSPSKSNCYNSGRP